MLISTFISICKDFFMLILSCISMAIGSLFSMPLFFDGSSYVISVGQILLALLLFNVIFGFIFSSLISHFKGGN